MKSFYDAFPTSNKYKGYTLMAVDGTDINLPTDRKDEIYRVKRKRFISNRLDRWNQMKRKYFTLIFLI